MNSNQKVRAGVFSDRTSADAAYKSAIDRGYRPEDVNVLMSDSTRTKLYPHNQNVRTETGDKSMEGLALGGALGGTVVGVLGALLAMSSTIVVPGLGLVVAGPIAAGLVGAGVGSVTGGVLGVLIGAGIPEERATVYSDEIKNGGIVITVKTRDDKTDQLLVDDWRKYHGRNID